VTTTVMGCDVCEVCSFPVANLVVPVEAHEAACRAERDARRAHAQHLVRDLSCPRCGAPRGERCRTSSGNVTRESHAGRDPEGRVWPFPSTWWRSVAEWSFVDLDRGDPLGAVVVFLAGGIRQFPECGLPFHRWDVARIAARWEMSFGEAAAGMRCLLDAGWLTPDPADSEVLVPTIPEAGR
jgi:hypothetical protein